MKKLLFLTPELPFPPQSGGKVKSMKLLQSLAERYEVTFVSPLKLDDEENFEAFLAVSPCRDHLVTPVHVPRSAYNLLASYVQSRPLNVRRTLDAGLRDRVGSIAHDYDVIVLDHYEVFAYLPDNYAGTVVYHAHNAYFKIWDRFARLPGNPAMRLAAFAEARRVRAYEAMVAKRASLVFAAPNDAEELVNSGIARDKIGDTYHLGDDTHLELPELNFAQTQKKLMYVGFLGWEPNVQGLLWFIDRVWPLLIEEHPELEFEIVGKNPDERLCEAVSRHRGIRLAGFVADLDSVYSESRVSVAPLLFGSGMKVKVLDAMARGIPTVTTRVGAEGIDIVNGEHLLVTDDEMLMATHVSTLLKNDAVWDKLRVNSRRLIRERYTWSRLFAAMHADIARVVNDRVAQIPAQSQALLNVS